MLCAIYMSWPVSTLIARAESEHEKQPPILPCHQEAVLCLPLHFFITWFLCSSRRSRCGQHAARKKENGSGFLRCFSEIIYSKRHTPKSRQVPQRVLYTKRISEKSKPTNRESAPDRWLDCCYSAAQRDCWAREKIKEAFVDTCNDTAHVYEHHITPFTSLSFAAGV